MYGRGGFSSLAQGEFQFLNTVISAEAMQPLSVSDKVHVRIVRSGSVTDAHD